MKKEEILYLELCVGYMTPYIIKYNFWNKMKKNKKGKYISINLEQNNVPKKIENRSLIISGDIYEILNQILLSFNEGKEKNNDL